MIRRQAVDVVVMGGGAVGSSVAYWLLKLEPSLSVAVVERDPSYKIASSALSVGSLRQQFSQPENVRMSQFGFNFMRDTLKDSISFDEGGYSFLASSGHGATVLQGNVALQQSLGAPIKLLEGASAVSAHFPWLNTDGIAAASVGVAGEGWFDPYAAPNAQGLANQLMMLQKIIRYMLTTELKRMAQAQGATYIKGTVCGVDARGDGGCVRNVHVATAGVTGGGAQLLELECGNAVVAAGCWSAGVVNMAMQGLSGGATSAAGTLTQLMPVAPRKRQVFTFRCTEKLDPPVPLLIDTSGMYVRRDGHPDKKQYLCGGMEGIAAPDPDCAGTQEELEVDYSYFDDHLWPRLAERIPSFGSIKVMSAWAGFYDYNFWDHNALLNTIPGFRNLFAATGFSGHGVQQAPAAGKATAELILHGEFRTQPGLSVFNTQRVLDGIKVLERNII